MIEETITVHVSDQQRDILIHALNNHLDALQYEVDDILESEPEDAHEMAAESMIRKEDIIDSHRSLVLKCASTLSRQPLELSGTEALHTVAALHHENQTLHQTLYDHTQRLVESRPNATLTDLTAPDTDLLNQKLQSISTIHHAIATAPQHVPGQEQSHPPPQRPRQTQTTSAPSVEDPYQPDSPVNIMTNQPLSSIHTSGPTIS